MSQIRESPRNDQSRKVRSFAWAEGPAGLVLSVIGGSLIGPVGNLVPCRGPFMKQVWRWLPVVMQFTFLAICRSIYNHFKPGSEYGSLTTMKSETPVRTLIYLVLSAVTQALWSVIMIWATINTV